MKILKRFILTCCLLGIFAGILNGLNRTHQIFRVDRVGQSHERVREGAVVHAEFELVNLSGDQLQIEDISGSCGCMKITDGDGRLYSLPFLVDQDESVPLFLEIATINATGTRDYAVTVAARNKGEPIHRETGTTQVQIDGLWRAEPSEVWLRRVRPGSNQEARVAIYDGITPSGIEIDSVEVSDSNRISADIACPQKAEETMRGLVQRHIMNIKYKVPESPLITRDYIEVIPTDSEIDSLKIPILYTLESNPIQISPAKIYTPKSESRFSRTIACFAPNIDQLDVIDPPKSLTYRVSRDGDRAYIELDFAGLDETQFVRIGDPSEPSSLATLEIVIE